MKYKELILSEIWLNKKLQKLNKVNNCCQKCWIKENLQLHHSHYQARFWNEKLKSLYILCNKCHYDFHNQYWTKLNMVIETREFLWLNQSYVFITKESIDFVKNWGKFKQNKFTKSIIEWRKVLKYIKDPIKYQNKVNIISN